MIDALTLEGLAWALSWMIVPLAILRYQISDTRHFLGFNAFLGGCLVLVYSMQGGTTGALVSLASASALAAQFFIGHKVSLGARLAIAAPAIGFAIAMRDPGFAALLPLLAFTLARLAEACRHDLGLRLTLLFCTGLWIAYGGILGLPQVVIFECLGLASNAAAIWRLHLRARWAARA